MIMKIIDYFFYITYRFAHFTLKKNENDSKWSAFLHTGVYFSILIATLICAFGLILENPISKFFKQSGLIGWMSLWIITPIVLSFRYNRKSILNIIESQYLSKIQSQQKRINWLICMIMLLLPVLLFIVYRLYIIGNVYW